MWEILCFKIGTPALHGGLKEPVDRRDEGGVWDTPGGHLLYKLKDAGGRKVRAWAGEILVGVTCSMRFLSYARPCKRCRDSLNF